MTPEDLVAEVCPKINDLGWAHYFHPTTLAAGEAMGLDGFRFYFLGRGGVLGDVEPDVVTSAFGWFAPELVASMWTSAKEVAAPRDAARAYLAASHQIAREKLADVGGLDEFCEAAGAVVDGAGRAAVPLFAGLAAEPMPDDAPARAYHLVNLLRELRGGEHLVAVVSVGLSPRIAHHLRRPEMDGSFGYAEAPDVTDEHRALLAEADAITDRLSAADFARAGERGALAIARGVEAIRAAFAG